MFLKYQQSDTDGYMYSIKQFIYKHLMFTFFEISCPPPTYVNELHCLLITNEHPIMMI